jgi:hypothetical protein
MTFSELAKALKTPRETLVARWKSAQQKLRAARDQRRQNDRARHAHPAVRRSAMRESMFPRFASSIAPISERSLFSRLIAPNSSYEHTAFINGCLFLEHK